MTIEEYANICKAFAHDTDNIDISEYKFFTTYGDYEWKESCDNAHGGLDISWAHRCSDEYIEKKAGQHLLNELIESIQISIDDRDDFDQLQSIVDKFR